MFQNHLSCSMPGFQNQEGGLGQTPETILFVQAQSDCSESLKELMQPHEGLAGGRFTAQSPTPQRTIMGGEKKNDAPQGQREHRDSNASGRGRCFGSRRRHARWRLSRDQGERYDGGSGWKFKLGDGELLRHGLLVNPALFAELDLLYRAGKIALGLANSV
jgi:hypothetical protein